MDGNALKNSNKRLSEGWIKVQEKFTSSRTSSLNVGQGDSFSSATINGNAAINKALLKDAAPKLCVSLLRHPSSIIYINIHKRIIEADNEWLEGFFRDDGLNILFEMLEQLTDTKQFNASSLSNFVLPMFCVECIKAVIKNDRSMELIVSVPDYAYKLVQVIDSDSFAVRSNAVQLLSALAYYSERGCRVTLEALKRFQHEKQKKYWTKVLIEELKVENAEYRASLMALINCILLNVDFEQRIKLRNELLVVGLSGLLSQLDEQSTTSERLSVQLELFLKYKNQDENDLEQNDGNDNVNDPYSLFETIMKKFDKTPQSVKFLTVLQYFSLVESDSSLNDRQWDIIEQFLAKILSVDINDQSTFNYFDKIDEITNKNTSNFSFVNRSTQTSDEDINQKLKRNIQNITSLIIKRKPTALTNNSIDTSKCVSKTQTPITQTSSARTLLQPSSKNISDKTKPEGTINNISSTNNQKKPSIVSKPVKKSPKNSVPPLSSTVAPKIKVNSGRKLSKPVNKCAISSPATTRLNKVGSSGPPVQEPTERKKDIQLQPVVPTHAPPLVPHLSEPSSQTQVLMKQYVTPQPPPPASLPSQAVQSTPMLPPPPSAPPIGLVVRTSPLAPPPPPPPPACSVRGAPPPPGGPPAPPSGIIVNDSQPLNERYATFPRQKCKKTKIVHWNKVVPFILRQKRNSLWMQNVDIPIDNVNLLQLEDLFSTEITAVKNEIVGDKGTTANTSAAKVIDEIYILDQKTSLKISLLLKQFRNLNVDQIVKLVLDNVKENEISLDKLRGLQRCMASEQDVLNVMNYDGDRSKFGLAEKFIWEVGQHSTFGLRLDVMCLQREVVDKCKTFAISFDFLTTCCESLMTNESLKKFLFLILHVGNYLNLGSNNGPAAGFKISSVKQLTGLKATNKNNTTLLHVTVESAESLDITMLNFVAELTNIHLAVKSDFETLKNDAISYSNEVKKLHGYVLGTKDKIFIEQVENFFQNTKILLSELDMKISTVEICSKNLQEYFCEDLKLSDMISLLSEFVKNVEKAKIEIEQRRLREERSAKLNEQQMLRKQGKRSAQTINETNLVESLLNQIREGDIKPRANAFLTDEQKEKARQKSRSVRQLLVDQSRDRR